MDRQDYTANLIQIQPMLRLNLPWGRNFCKTAQNSNTTNVKVKHLLNAHMALRHEYSNTTNVKVKLCHDSGGNDTSWAFKYNQC